MGAGPTGAAPLEAVPLEAVPVEAVPVEGARSGALAGLRVLELGHLIAGPFCGHLFADHGAEVIKVEPPGAGDPMRAWGGLLEGVSLHWTVIARGKRSITLDLRRPEAQEAFRALVATADVLVENFRPGTLERWGLGPQDLAEINPRLIVVRVTGFGQTGPYRDRAGFGSVAEAMSGLRHLSGEPGRAPVRVGISLGDAVGGTQGLVGALLALWARDRPGGSGVGQVVDVALYEAMWMYMESMLAEAQLLERPREPTGALLPGVAPSSVYPTRDGDWILVAANQDSVFRRLAELMGRPDWVTDEAPYRTHVGRGARQAELDEEIQRWTLTRDSADLLAALAAAGVPGGRIYTARDIATDPHYAAREMIAPVRVPGLAQPVPTPGVVPKLSRTPGRATDAPPALGEHTAAVLEPLLGSARLAELRALGAV